MKTLSDGTQWEPSGRGLSGGVLSDNAQRWESVRTLREGTQWEPSGRGLGENLQGGDSVRRLREGTR